MRYLARRELGRPLRVYPVDAEAGAPSGGTFSPTLGDAAERTPSALANPGTWAIADTRDGALAALQCVEEFAL